MVSDRYGRPMQELLAAWRAGSAEGSTSRVCAPEEGQRLPERAHRSISLSRLLLAQRRVRNKLRHYRPRVAVIVRARPAAVMATRWSRAHGEVYLRRKWNGGGVADVEKFMAGLWLG